jgi:hypothetical protein
MTSHASPRMILLCMGCTVALMAAGVAARPEAQANAPGQGAPAAPGARAGGGGRGRGGLPVTAYSDYAGFTKLWDGSTFTNWDGERDVWSIEDGMLHADTTKTPGQHHIHYTGPGAIVKDFDLRVEFKMSATGANGGIQYRSRLLHASHGGSIDNPLGKALPAGITTFDQAVAAGLASQPAPRGGGPGAAGGRPGGPGPAGAAGGGRPGGGPAGGAPAAPQTVAPTGPCTSGGFGGGGRGPNGPTTEPNPWQVSGYQFDMDSANMYTGQLYEGQGRGIVTAPGTMSELLTGGKLNCLAVLSETPTAFVKPHMGLAGEWNQAEIIARGNTLVHLLNGHVLSVTIDDDTEYRAFQGILSLQLEGSGQIWYRNVYLKTLDPPMPFPR